MATNPATVATTIDALFAPGKGVLVLDRYAEVAVATSRRRPADLDRFLAMVVSTPRLEDAVSGVLLTADGLRSTAQVRSALSLGSRLIVGVSLPARSASAERVEHVRAAEAQVVELRANLGPGQAPKGGPASETRLLARGARHVLAAGLQPVLTFAMPDLGTQTLNVTHAVTANALRSLVHACLDEGIDPQRLVVRVNMIAAGSSLLDTSEDAQVGRATAAVLRENLPDSIGGVLLLSGGLPLFRACDWLAQVRSAARADAAPWPVTFAFSRPLVEEASRHWDGTEGSPVSQRALAASCRAAADALVAGSEL